MGLKKQHKTYYQEEEDEAEKEMEFVVSKSRGEKKKSGIGTMRFVLMCFDFH